MKISHLGAKDCVTGSCHLVQTKPGSADGVNILVDCGSVYGNDPEMPFDRFPVSVGKVDSLFWTHAHIDHIRLVHGESKARRALVLAPGNIEDVVRL